MTTDRDPDMTPEQMDEAVATAQQILRRRIDELEHAKAVQPERLAQARAGADEARGWALIEEPWESQITAVPTCNSGGERTGGALTLPNITAKELWGTRALFDVLDCGDDEDALDEAFARYFTQLHGDTGNLFLIFASALRTAANLVVPQLLSVIEEQASDYDTRVMLAEARAKAWNGRVNELQQELDQPESEGLE